MIVQDEDDEGRKADEPEVKPAQKVKTSAAPAGEEERKADEPGAKPAQKDRTAAPPAGEEGKKPAGPEAKPARKDTPAVPPEADERPDATMPGADRSERTSRVAEARSAGRPRVDAPQPTGESKNATPPRPVKTDRADRLKRRSARLADAQPAPQDQASAGAIPSGQAVVPVGPQARAAGERAASERPQPQSDRDGGPAPRPRADDQAAGAAIEGAAPASPRARPPAPVDARTTVARAGSAAPPATRSGAGALLWPFASGSLDRRPRRMSASRAAILSMTSQDAPLVEAEEDDDPLRTIQRAAMRVAGLAWLAGAVLVWGRLVGYFDTGLVPLWYAPQGPWIVTLVAAILAPVVSVGLWLASSWGGVIWAFAITLGWVVAIATPESLPFGFIALALNTLALVAVACLAGFRAWRDRDPDD